MRKKLLVVGAVVAAASVGACTSPEKKVEKATENVEEATADVCTEIDSFGSALERYGDITAETPLSEVKSADAAVQEAWAALGKSLQKLDKAEAQVESAAYDRYRQAVDTIPDSTTLGDAAEGISAALVQLQNTQAALKRVQCR
jgi:hypothetical protein